MDYASPDREAPATQPPAGAAPAWPAAVRWHLVDAIANRVELLVHAGSDPQLAAMLAIRRRPAELLDSLDREARRLYAGDRSAAVAIRTLLDPIACHAPRPSWSSNKGARRVREGITRLTIEPRGFPRLSGEGIVDPVAMLYVATAVEHAAGADTLRGARFAAAVDFLWRESGRLNSLARYARETLGTGADRLETLLRREGDLLRARRWWPGGGEGGPGKGPGGFPPGGPDPSEPGAFGPGLSGWLPDGDPNTGQGGVDADEWLDDLLRGHFVGKVPVGVGVFTPQPPDVRADTISSLIPNPACPGELFTIHGAGFGASQPSDVDVVLDCPGLFFGGMVLDVLSWSDTAIVVRVPAGALSGCVGFRNRILEAQRARMAGTDGRLRHPEHGPRASGASAARHAA